MAMNYYFSFLIFGFLRYRHRDLSHIYQHVECPVAFFATFANIRNFERKRKRKRKKFVQRRKLKQLRKVF